MVEAVEQQWLVYMGLSHPEELHVPFTIPERIIKHIGGTISGLNPEESEFMLGFGVTSSEELAAQESARTLVQGALAELNISWASISWVSVSAYTDFDVNRLLGDFLKDPAFELMRQRFFELMEQEADMEASAPDATMYEFPVRPSED